MGPESSSGFDPRLNPEAQPIILNSEGPTYGRIEIIKSPEEQEKDARKLLELMGLEQSPEHIEVLVDQYRTLQIASDVPKISEQLVLGDELDRDLLTAAMKEYGINKIMHAEGLTVGEHVRSVTEAAMAISGLSGEEKRDLMMLILLHDLGKAEVVESEKNVKRNHEKRDAGELVMSMIGHADLKKLPGSEPKITSALEKNGITGDRLQNFRTVIDKHMSALDVDASIPDDKLVKFVESLASTEADQKWVLTQLVRVAHADGGGTKVIELGDDGVLSVKTKQAESDPNKLAEELWQRASKIMTERAKEQQEAAVRNSLIAEVTGTLKLSAYLIQRGIKPGPALGQLSALINDATQEFLETKQEYLEKDRPAALEALRQKYDEIISQ